MTVYACQRHHDGREDHWYRLGAQPGDRCLCGQRQLGVVQIKETRVTIALEPADFPRDRWTRPLVLVDGQMEPYQRPSSLGDCIDNRWNLELYKQRRAVQGLATDHAIYATAVSLEITDTKDNKQEWNRLVEKAQDAVRSSARAELGTALHKMTERADRGEALDLPPVFAADVKAYHDALAMAGLTVVPGMIECRCVCDEVKAAGTFDRLVRDAEGNVYVADLKTGEGVYPHGFAIQLAIYANAELYDPTTGERTPMPDRLDRSRGVIIHLPAGQGCCTTEFIDLDKGWHAAKIANWVRNDWQKDKGLLSRLSIVRAEAPTGPAPEPTSWLRAEQLRARIAKLTPAQQAELKAEWPKGISLKRDVTREESSIVEALVVRYEATVEAVKVTPDEGRPADPGTVRALEHRFDTQLDDEGKAWIKDLAVVAYRSGGGLGLNINPSLRRFEIMRALIFLARHGLQDRLPDLIAATLGDVPGSPGALLASMGVHDAARFAQLVDALAVGDGEPTPLTLLDAAS